MLISVDWVKEFVTLPEMNPKELGDKFTMSTAEVEEVKVVGDHLEKIRVSEVVSIEPHPNADKLRLVTFKISDGETKQVVCGAPNVKVGMKTPYAPLGTLLPNGLLLEPKKIRGIVSEGMLCSESELGISEESSGIMNLPNDAPLGETLLIYFNEKKDILIDVDNKSLTHRPDLWGHYGISREFAAVFGSKLDVPYDEKWAESYRKQCDKSDSPMSVEVKGENACLGYYGLSVDNIEVKESPDWMKRRLTSVGLRPINNIVDISNYVMLELGHPLHIFDREKIKGNKVIIHALEKEESFLTLDEVERTLIPGDTVISDETGPLVVAGIMGGLSSGVEDKTKKIFIEVANWKPAKVRRTSTRLGLRTESSQRYEKSLDSFLMERTLFRTLELVLQLCPNAKIVGKVEYDGESFWQKKPVRIDTCFSKIRKVLGHPTPDEKILSILEDLDFKVEVEGDNLLVTVPTYIATKDIENESDIVEEVGRIVGYDNITPESPKVSVTPVRLSEVQKLQRKIREFLALNGCSYEIMTYPMVGRNLLKQASWDYGKEIPILNSISNEHDRMRASLVPSLLEAASKNQKSYSEFRAFELGRSYIGNSKTFSKDHNQLAIMFYNKDESPFMELINLTEKLLEWTNISGQFVERHPKFKNSLIPEDWEGCHPFEFLNIRIMGKMNGVVLSIHPTVLKSFKIKGHLSLALIDTSSFEDKELKEKIKYSPLPKFPSSTFDCTIVAEKKQNISAVLGALSKLKIKELVSTKVVDVFELNERQKTVTLRSLFLNPEKTLSGDFISDASKQIVEALGNKGFPLKN